ncbi:PQQ-dependent sugar dehydrogenase [soil metagenome]
MPLVALATACGGSDARTVTAAPVQPAGAAGELRVKPVATGLDTPWDLAWGPDGWLWFTERGGNVSRLDPATGEVVRVGQVDVEESGESGLMGMAFHPDFEAQPYVYLAHSYRSGGGIRNRLVRARYENGTLGPPETLLEGIPGARNHDGPRLAIGPDGFLYMTTGDAGNGSLAQDRSSLAGKILRLTLDGRPAPGNPFGSAVFSYGHRNPQGLVFQPGTGALYISEHGPGSDDEVNRVEAGRNYGWPEVKGSCESGEVDFCRANRVVEPVTSWTPTIAVAGADFYDAELIPGWRGNLLVTALRGAQLVRITLSEDGSGATERETLFDGRFGRLRDVLAGPDGAVYLATSNRDGRGRPRDGDDRILRVEP